MCRLYYLGGALPDDLLLIDVLQLPLLVIVEVVDHEVHGGAGWVERRT